MGCLAALVCMALPVAGIVPTKDVETPFECLKSLTAVSQSHSSHWSHGVYDVSCDYVSEADEGVVYKSLQSGFLKYLALPARRKDGSAKWQVVVDGVVYQFRFETTLDSIRKEQGNTVKIDVRPRPHLSMSMSVPLDGFVPKRWWKGAIYSGGKPPTFQWDKSVVAIAGQTERLNYGHLYQAIVNRSFEEYSASMRLILLNKGYWESREGSDVRVYQNLEDHTYRVVISKAGADRTAVQWSVIKNVLKLHRKLRPGAAG